MRNTNNTSINITTNNIEILLTKRCDQMAEMYESNSDFQMI